MNDARSPKGRAPTPIGHEPHAAPTPLEHDPHAARTVTIGPRGPRPGAPHQVRHALAPRRVHRQPCGDRFAGAAPGPAPGLGLPPCALARACYAAARKASCRPPKPPIVALATLAARVRPCCLPPGSAPSPSSLPASRAPGAGLRQSAHRPQSRPASRPTARWARARRHLAGGRPRGPAPPRHRARPRRPRRAPVRPQARRLAGSVAGVARAAASEATSAGSTSLPAARSPPTIASRPARRGRCACGRASCTARAAIECRPTTCSSRYRIALAAEGRRPRPSLLR
jgi:hypothetical protein